MIPTYIGGEDARPLSETIFNYESTPEDSVANDEISTMVSEKLRILRDTKQPTRSRYRDLRLIATDPISLQELGDQYSVSKERICQLKPELRLTSKSSCREN